MLNHLKIGVFSQIDKDLYLSFCGTASPETLWYCENAFLALHKDIVSGKVDEATIEKFLTNPAFVQDYIEVERLLNLQNNREDIQTILQSISDKLDDHAGKSDASFKKLIFNASVYCVLPLSLATNVATAFFTEEIADFKQAVLRVIKGEPAVLPKSLQLAPAHAPVKKTPKPQSDPNRKPISGKIAAAFPLPCY